jgi:NAD(P)-dependent dehydrogenase (short-subunit alcohol dehydrogenase family)
MNLKILLYPPNIICYFRLLLLYLYTYTDNYYYILISMSLDMIDGYIARKYNYISKLGEVLDNFIDRLSILISWIHNFTILSNLSNFIYMYSIFAIVLEVFHLINLSNTLTTTKKRKTYNKIILAVRKNGYYNIYGLIRMFAKFCSPIYFRHLNLNILFIDIFIYCGIIIDITIGIIFLYEEYFCTPIMYLKHWLYYKIKNTDRKLLNGKIVLITGGRGSIANELIKQMVENGCKVIFTVRNQEDGDQILKENHNVSYFLLNLQDIDDVYKFINEFKKKHKVLDILINNAATINSKVDLKYNNISNHLTVNYLSNIILIENLIEIMPSNSIIVNITSRMHFQIKDLELKTLKVDCNYAISKLCQVMMTQYYSRLYKNIKIICVHPGVVYNAYYKNKSKYLKYILRDNKDAANAILSTMLLKNLESGKYYYNTNVLYSSNLSYDLSLQEELYDYSKKLIESYTKII